VDFDGANLHEANLDGSDLRGATFRRADLHKAILHDANLSKMDLREADLHEADLFRSDLQGAYLLTADLSGANLQEANLQGADLRKANLRGADLHNAILHNVDLREANLSYTKLSGADLAGAILLDTLFINTILADTRGLDLCRHYGQSTLDFRTLDWSGQLPLTFLRGCGLQDVLIDYLPALFSQPIQFYSCFISYSTVDQSFAKRLYTDLQGKGVRCWFAPHAIQAGKKIHEQIDEAIRVYDRLLLILSEASWRANG
jgi:uncharacterized protein YjbI with pentapeptide repeats